MLSLSPAKLLVVLVIALIVLGPEKLPQVARQIGALWGDVRRWRERIESEVRSTFPDLPPTHEVVKAVRSPLSFLDRLADAHESASNSAGTVGTSAALTAARSPAAGQQAALTRSTPANGLPDALAADAPGDHEPRSSAGPPSSATTPAAQGGLHVARDALSGPVHPLTAGDRRAAAGSNGVRPDNGAETVDGARTDEGARMDEGATSPEWSYDDPSMN